MYDLTNYFAVLHKGANHLTSPRILVQPPSDPEFRYTHLLLQNEIPFEATLSYLLHARQIQATAIYNPSPMPSPAQLREFPWNHLEWLIVNEGEVVDLLNVLGPAAPSIVQRSESTDRLSTARNLLSELHRSPLFSPSLNVICTLGELGLLALIHGNAMGEHYGIIHVPAAKLEGEVQDTTGAGDCFTGYFVAGLMQVSIQSPPAAENGLLLALQMAVEASQFNFFLTFLS